MFFFAFAYFKVQILQILLAAKCFNKNQVFTEKENLDKTASQN
jgi:hypothetical protein